ncbi:HypC/HybG/HupF family hydrogenase formation chaperone [Limnochorda pilosa]|uniref:Hydrogenase expression/formation protein HupF/C n=1 Tax=Limnochorda pilosa TaxID=1555112 RepID=A0A0K2SHA2_LIMPI|nr:HypC/HybG/HupF family hydrogenase formation chaperone [Limnochorda pilosa]BAS26501.1 hydrogenase expression/formation protein HupF/C [Limnochorda pilosa]
MCLAIPGRILELRDDRMALVDMGGITRRVSLDLLEGVGVGDWVTIHVGFAISRIDETEARQTLELLRQIADAMEDPALAGLPVDEPSQAPESRGGPRALR